MDVGKPTGRIFPIGCFRDGSTFEMPGLGYTVGSGSHDALLVWLDRGTALITENHHAAPYPSGVD